MESQIIDYYNELPYGINVIDEMNKELIEEKSTEAIIFYKKIQKDIEKELKQYL